MARKGVRVVLEALSGPLQVLEAMQLPPRWGGGQLGAVVSTSR